MRYLVLRVCERMGIGLEAFEALPRGRQVELLGYEDLRQAEEAESFGCPMFGGGKE